jgi:hypothetical protein
MPRKGVNVPVEATYEALARAANTHELITTNHRIAIAQVHALLAVAQAIERLADCVEVKDTTLYFRPPSLKPEKE